MKPILFKIGSVNFYTHGFFLVMAMAAAGALVYYLAKRKRLKTEAVFDLVVFSLLVGVLAARITYFLAYRDQFQGLADLFRIWQGGLVSWGGFAAGVLAYVMIVRFYKQPVRPWLDLLGISGLLGIVIGRLGSFLSGEYAGRASTVPLAINGVHPVTLYEAGLLLLLFFLFLSLYLKAKLKTDGLYFLLVGLTYSLVRFGLDFLRVDSIVWLGLTMTQLISSLIILAIIAYLVAAMPTKKGTRHARS